MPSNLEKEQISNGSITTDSESIIESIESTLRLADQDKTSTDLNYIKSMIDKLIPQKIGPDTKVIYLLHILNGYRQQNDLKLLSMEIRGYFSALCLTLLDDINFTLVYNNPILQDLFNQLLLHHLNTCNELQLSRLFESFVRFKTSCGSKNTISFFQIHIVKQLYEKKMFDQINQLLEKFKIDDFDSITDVKLVQNRLFTYFLEISQTLIVFKSYERAHQTMNITFNLKLQSVVISEFQHMLSSFIFTSMMLNISRENTSVIILKYKYKIYPRLLSIYQSYQTFDLESFVCNYYLYIQQLSFNNQSPLLLMFNKDSLVKLSFQLIYNRFGILRGNVSSGIIPEFEISANHTIDHINSKLEKYDFQLPKFKFEHPEEIELYNEHLLENDAQKLISTNKCLKEIYKSMR